MKVKIINCQAYDLKNHTLDLILKNWYSLCVKASNHIFRGAL